MKRIVLLLLACFPSVFMLAQVPETYWIPDNVGQFNITLFAQLSLAGDVPNSQESPVANYELGVFDQDGKCCGVAFPPTWKNVRQRWVYSLAIQGETGSTYTFKIYDHATGQEQVLSMACSEDVDRYEFNVVEDASSPNYGDGCTYGYTYAPDTLHFMPAQSIALVEGWNWLSFYVEADDLLEQLEESLGDHGISIQTFDDVADYFGDGIWSGLEGYELSNGEMVMVEVEENCNITLIGTVVDASLVEIPINPGWNWIGFPIATETAIDVALSDFNPEFEDVIQNFDGTSDYLGVWSGDVGTLVPGQGYMYYSSSEDTKTLVFSMSTRTKKPAPSKVLVP